MKMLKLDAAAVKQLDILNLKGAAHRQLCTVTLPDGTEALNADIASDCGKGQTWEHYGPLILTLPVSDVPDAELPTEATPERLWSTQKVAARVETYPKEDLPPDPKEAETVKVAADAEVRP